MRTWDLTGVPPGLTHDEASNGHDASAILTGHHALYFPVGYGHEPLYNYSVAALTYFLGEGIFSLRFTSVLWSLLTWSLTVALSRRWWGKRASVLTAAVITASFWAQMMGRVGLRAPVLPALFAASVLFFDRAVSQSRHSTRNYCFSGLFLGASFYTYMASRGLPLIFIIFLVCLFLIHRSTFQRIWRGSALTLGAAFLTGLPLMIYLTNHPELEQRVGQLGGAITAFFDGNWQPLLKNITDSLPLLLWRGDPRWLYNIGGRAALEPMFAGFLCVGLLIALSQISTQRNLFLLLWLGCGLAPALLTSVEYNTLHAIAAMPAAFLLVTLGINSVMKLLISAQNRFAGAEKIKPFSIGPFIIYAGLLLAFIATGIESMQAYFTCWGENRDVRVAYHHHIVSLGRELSIPGTSSPVVISSLYPGQFHDPYTMDITLGNLSLPLRWVDGRSAVFLPSSQTRLYIDPQAMFPDSLWVFIKPDLQTQNDLTFKPDDIPAKIESYLWDSNTTWARITAAFKYNFFYAVENKADALQNTGRMSAPVDFNGVVRLDGYHLTRNNQPSDDHVVVLTAWSVLRAYNDELVIFIHLLDQGGNILTQQDTLAAPSWQWEKGDRFLHHHEFTLPPDTATEEAMIAVGLYRRDDLARLPIVSESQNLTRALIRMDTTGQ